MRESVFYQDILQEGREEGREEGKEEGRLEEALFLVKRLLTRKFGTITPELETQIQTLSIIQLEQLGEDLLDFRELTDLSVWLEQF